MTSKLLLAALAAGQSISDLGNCTPPDGTFACGPVYCGSNQQFCYVAGSDVASVPSTFECDPLPSQCDGGLATCACLGSGSCDCTELGPGELRVVCAGG